jgi:hypothetical protein
VMAATAGALTTGDRFPPELWSVLWTDPTVSIDPSIDREVLEQWDHLLNCPLDPLVASVERDASHAGKRLLKTLQRGEMAKAMDMLGGDLRAKSEMLDRSTGLSFFMLKDWLERASHDLIPHDRRLPFSVAGARLAARHLKGDHIDDWG